jgi:hypothetical protein
MKRREFITIPASFFTAAEAGVVICNDRKLAGPYGRDKYRYTRAPWVESVPEHGYQDKENPGRSTFPPQASQPGAGGGSRGQRLGRGNRLKLTCEI